MGNHKNKKEEIVCRCNLISKKTIEKAIVDGCRTMNEIYDCTSAGVGPCGGSCRKKMQPLLEHYLSIGEFLSFEELTKIDIKPKDETE